MPAPEISVIVPTLGKRSSIAVTLASLIYFDTDLEVIVVAPPDKIEQIRSTLRPVSNISLRVIPQTTRGQASAILEGWQEATGAWLTWINDDDICLPGAAAFARAFTEAHDPDIGLVYGDIIIQTQNVCTPVRSPHRVNRSMFRGGRCYVPGVLPMIRSEVLERVDLARDNDLAFDLEWWIQILEQYSGKHITSFVGMLIEHPDARTQEFGAQAAVQRRAIIRTHFGAGVIPTRLWRYLIALSARMQRG